MKNKYLLLLAMLFVLPLVGISQINLAPLATPSHSGGGTGVYGPANYNDGVITTTVFGWISATNTSGFSAWFQLEWPTVQVMDNITIFPDEATTRTLTGATIQYWDGAAWVNHHTYTVPPSTMYNVQFPAVATTRLRVSDFTITGAFNQNPAINEVEVYLSVSGENNAGIQSLVSPTGGCEGTYPIDVLVGNFGTNQITSLTVEWEHNTIPQTPFNITQTLDTLQGLTPSTMMVNLGNITLTAGQADSIKIWTSMPNGVVDTVTSNDTVKRVFDNVLVSNNTYPYIEDFENGQASWEMSTGSSSWDFGTPAKPVINGAASGVNAFVTGGLTGQYIPNEDSEVSSPCFDFSGIEGEPWVAVDVWWNSEFSWDGAVLQYSADAGQSWNNVGAFGDPFNWYTDNTINGNPGGSQEGWSGRASTNNGSGGWVQAKHALPESLIGNRTVRFRVAFGSDGSVQDEGFGFDNFVIVDYKAADLGPDILSLCGEAQLVLDPNVDFPGEIEWSTGDTTNATITVTSAGTYSVIYTDSILGLVSGDTAEVIITDPPAINFSKSIDTVAVTSQITFDPNLSFDLEYLWLPGDITYPYLLVKGSDYGLGAHTFNLKVTDSVQCTDEAVAIAVFVNYIGVDEAEKGQVVFYPNPVKDRMTVQLDNVNADLLTIYNEVGQVVYSKPIVNQSTIEMNLSDYRSGMYMVVLAVGDEQIVHKFIKE